MGEVLGRVERLSDERLVFVGHDAERPNRIYLGFRNEDGAVTRMTLSNEAAAALARLLSGSAAGDERFPPDLKKVWRVVDAALAFADDTP